MSGSGLQEVLELIFASNGVSHILNGKAVSRALCGNFLVNSAVNTILASMTFQVE